MTRRTRKRRIAGYNIITRCAGAVLNAMIRKGKNVNRVCERGTKFVKEKNIGNILPTIFNPMISSQLFSLIIFLKYHRNNLSYHKSNLVYTVVFPQFFIFQQNNSAETKRKLTLTSGHYYLVEKLKIVEKHCVN